MSPSPSYQELEQRVRELEEALRERNAILHQLPDHLVIQDLEHRILWANQAARESVNLTMPDMRGRQCHVLWGQSPDPCPDCPMPASLETGGRASVEKKTPDGRTWRVRCSPFSDSRGNVTKIIEVTEEISEAVRMREARQEAEAHKRLILDTMQEMVAYHDTDLRVKWANRAAADSVGRREDDLVGRHCHEVWQKRDVPCEGCPVLKAMETGRPHEREASTPDGRTYHIRGYPAYGDDGRLIGAVEFGFDMTGVRRAEAALRNSEELFRTVFEQSAVGVAQVLPDGRFMELNARFCDIVGYARDALYDMTFRDITHPDDLNLDEKHIARVVAGEADGFDIEKRYIRKDGRVIWIRLCSNVVRDADGAVKYAIATVVDISEKKAAEERLQSQHRFMQLLMDAIPISVFYKDADGAYIGCNDAYAAFLGKSKADIAGKGVHDVFPQDLADVYRDMDRRLLYQPGVQQYEARMNHADGTRHDVLFNKATYLDESGNVAGIIGTMIDVTERKEMENRLQQTQRMESIGALAGGIAHDFNNILFPITGLSEMLLEDLPEGGPEHENVREILKAGKRGADLVKQILAFSRQAEHKKLPIRMQQIIKEVLKLTRSTIPASIDIRQSIENDCGMVMADPTQIYQIAMNLITNAYHAAESGGEISVTLKEAVVRKDAPERGGPPPGNFAVLTVSDTGAGIDPAVMDKIFDPYFTTKAQGKGAGLGLAVVYGLVHEHGGHIRAESPPGGGAAFHVCLPLMETSDEPLSPEVAAEYQPGFERILLVDDEAPIAKLEKQMLERLGYRVAARVSSADALAAFMADPAGFDLVMTDMAMPGMSGDRLARELIAIRPDIPIILCTGFSERINREKARAMGIRGFLMKPAGRADMARLVRSVLDGEARSDAT